MKKQNTEFVRKQLQEFASNSDKGKFSLIRIFHVIFDIPLFDAKDIVNDPVVLEFANKKNDIEKVIDVLKSKGFIVDLLKFKCKENIIFCYDHYIELGFDNPLEAVEDYIQRLKQKVVHSHE
jgi:Icc-related predicted phosphoesterase